MKDLVQLWNRLVGGTYDVVNTNARFKCENANNKDLSDPYTVEGISRRWPITLVLLGFASVLTGVLLYVINPYDLVFRYKMVFAEGGEIFELWRDPPADLYLKVYLWNVTNKEEFMSGQDKKLKMQEVGPYVYKEVYSHGNATFNKNGTVSVIPLHPLVFVPELSEGRLENDTLILPNIALLSIAHVVSDQSYFTRLGLNMLIRQLDLQPLVKMTSREFMFNYTNSLMHLGNQFLPNWISFDHLGLIDRMYDFDGDFETVYTGEDDIRKAGLIDKWRGSTEIPQWEKPCGTVRGASDGTKFPVFIKPEEKLYFYRKSMCRAKYLKRINETVKDGHKAFVYNFEIENDWNEQDCFCENKEKCFPRGLLDVHGCYYGFPIALSAPHFCNNEPILKAKVEGMAPDPEKHTSYFIIEPITGSPLELKANFQINMALGDITAIANVDKFADMVLPLLWAEFRVYGITDKLRSKLTLYLKFLPVVTDVGTYGSMIGGFLLLIYAIYGLTIRTREASNRKKSPWIQDAPHFIKSKLSNYKLDKEAGLHGDAKELETYYHSIIVPLTNELEGSEECNNRKCSATA